jgi:hypothetical protein
MTMAKQRLGRICKKRPPWKYKNCPPGVCKRCYHKHVWPERPGARGGREHPAGEPEAPPPGTQPMVYDGYYGRFVPIEAASFDVSTTPDAVVELPLDAETPIRPATRKLRDGAAIRRRTQGA